MTTHRFPQLPFLRITLGLAVLCMLPSCYHAPEYSYEKPTQDVDHLIEGLIGRGSARKKRLRGDQLGVNEFVQGDNAAPAAPAPAPPKAKAKPARTPAEERPVVAPPANDKWGTDFNAARAEARRAGKAILLNFSGSDWCEYCQAMDREIFDTPKFNSYAAQNLVLVRADFPRNSRLPADLTTRNEELREHYKIEGFPTVVVLSPDGTYLGQTNYQPGGPDPFVAALKNARGGR